MQGCRNGRPSTCMPEEHRRPLSSARQPSMLIALRWCDLSFPVDTLTLQQHVHFASHSTPSPVFETHTSLIRVQRLQNCACRGSVVHQLSCVHNSSPSALLYGTLTSMSTSPSLATFTQTLGYPSHPTSLVPQRLDGLDRPCQVNAILTHSDARVTFLSPASI